VAATIDMGSAVAVVTPESGSADPRYATAFVGCGSSGDGIQVNVFDGIGTPVDSPFYVTVP
jgi:hypothetical protein